MDGDVRAWREPWYTDYTRPVYVADDFISFKEKGIEDALVARFDSDGDGKLSKIEAATVTSLVGVLGIDKDYESFDEF